MKLVSNGAGEVLKSSRKRRPRRARVLVSGLLFLTLAVMVTSGCAKNRTDYDGFSTYGDHFRASDPGLSGIWETGEMIGAGGWSNVGEAVSHLEGGVVGWSIFYEWIAWMFEPEEWSELGMFFDLWRI